MSRFNRHDPWAEPTQNSNATRRRVFHDEDTSNMQMSRRPQHSSRPPQSTTSGALTRRPTERVESWRNEQRDDGLSGAMSRMRVSEQRSTPARPARQRSPSAPPPPPRRRERETPRSPAQRRRARPASPSPPPTRRRPSLPPTRSRRAPSPDWNEEEPARTRAPRRAAQPPSLPPFANPFDEFAVPRRTRNPLSFDDVPARSTRGPWRTQPSSSSYSITTTLYSSTSGGVSRTSSPATMGRIRDAFWATRHGAGAQHDPGCPYCFTTQGEALRAAAEWCAKGDECWVEWDAHRNGMWGLMVPVDDECAGGCGDTGFVWY